MKMFLTRISKIVDRKNLVSPEKITKKCAIELGA